MEDDIKSRETLSEAYNRGYQHGWNALYTKLMSLQEPSGIRAIREANGIDLPDMLVTYPANDLASRNSRLMGQITDLQIRVARLEKENKELQAYIPKGIALRRASYIPEDEPQRKYPCSECKGTYVHHFDCPLGTGV